jgi:hypothetical protein
MQLLLQNIDMRGGDGDSYWMTKVTDKDTGKEVGTLRHERSPAVRRISLYGGKYHGKFKTFDECAAFARGVEAVFNHMVELPDAEAQQAA